jgi:hypothetical protein
MVVRDQRRAKTENLSIRLDPKTRFMLEFLGRVTGNSITSVVERAIRESADRIGIGPDHDEHGNQIEERHWNTYWDPSDAVRMLNLISDAYYPTNFEEDELRKFTLAHWKFFFMNEKGQNPRRAYCDILWPKIDEYLECWRQCKSTNYWKAGELMLADLRAARVAPPSDWPPKSAEKTKHVAEELDDDIPF